MNLYFNFLSILLGFCASLPLLQALSHVCSIFRNFLVLAINPIMIAPIRRPADYQIIALLGTPASLLVTLLSRAEHFLSRALHWKVEQSTYCPEMRSAGNPPHCHCRRTGRLERSNPRRSTNSIEMFYFFFKGSSKQCKRTDLRKALVGE